MENNRNDIKEFVDYMASSFPHPLEPFRAELHGEDLEKVHPGLSQKLVKIEIFERTRAGFETEKEIELELSERLHSDNEIPNDLYEITIWNEVTPKQMMCEFINKHNIPLDEDEVAKFVFTHDDEVLKLRLEHIDQLDIYVDVYEYLE